jgi:mono/diheme cytochrome c family protein
MPSFRLLPDGERSALVEYVKYLSIRGETERWLIERVMELPEDDPNTPADEYSLLNHFATQEDLVQEIVVGLVSFFWEDAANQVIQPEPPTVVYQPELTDDQNQQLRDSIAKGHDLFIRKDKGNCMQCHGTLGLGDGTTNDFDEWTKEGASKLLAMQDGDDLLHEAGGLWPRNAQPRDLRQGVYRFGRRPLDLYRRVSAGIAGTPMPGVGPAQPGSQGTLTPEEIWDIVNYVRSLPFEPLSQPTATQHALIQRERL